MRALRHSAGAAWKADRSSRPTESATDAAPLLSRARGPADANLGPDHLNEADRRKQIETRLLHTDALIPWLSVRPLIVTFTTIFLETDFLGL